MKTSKAPIRLKSNQLKSDLKNEIKLKVVVKLIKCKCGCGQILLDHDKYGRPREYILGHQNRGFSKITRQKISLTRLGQNNCAWKGDKKCPRY